MSIGRSHVAGSYAHKFVDIPSGINRPLPAFTEHTGDIGSKSSGAPSGRPHGRTTGFRKIGDIVSNGGVLGHEIERVQARGHVFALVPGGCGSKGETFFFCAKSIILVASQLGCELTGV